MALRLERPLRLQRSDPSPSVGRYAVLYIMIEYLLARHVMLFGIPSPGALIDA